MNSDPIDRLLREVEPRVLSLVVAAFFAIAVLAGLLYGLKPAWAEYASLKQEHERAQQGSAEGTASAATSIARLRAEVEVQRDRLHGGAAGIPRRQIEAFVVDSLDRISSRHEVRLLGITPDAPASVWMFEELPYQVEVEGSFFAIHQWLYDVEKELRPMVVKQFQLSPNRRNESVILDLRVVAYRSNAESGA